MPDYIAINIGAALGTDLFPTPLMQALRPQGISSTVPERPGRFFGTLYQAGCSTWGPCRTFRIVLDSILMKQVRSSDGATVLLPNTFPHTILIPFGVRFWTGCLRRSRPFQELKENRYSHAGYLVRFVKRRWQNSAPTCKGLGPCNLAGTPSSRTESSKILRI